MKTKLSNTVCFVVHLWPTSSSPQVSNTGPSSQKVLNTYSELERAFVIIQLFFCPFSSPKGVGPLQVLSLTSEKRQSSKMDNGGHMGFRGAKRPSSSRTGQQQMPFWSGIQGGRLECGGGSILLLPCRTNKTPLPNAMHLLRNVKTPKTCSLETSSP